jgi:PPM family protein phosphatase
MSRVKAYARSNVGSVRSNNEDAFIVDDEHLLFAVCDGLGGHVAGEIASELAVQTIREAVAADSSDPESLLRRAIREANEIICNDQMGNPAHRGMGTTVSCLWITNGDGDLAWIGHVGDSRVYRHRDQVLEQLTDDHSPIFALFKEGQISKDELRAHPQKNLIQRSLGQSRVLEVDLLPIKIRPRDTYLLCTDGLSDYVSDSDISRALEEDSLEAATERLEKMALDAGGYDNVTVVLVRVC